MDPTVDRDVLLALYRYNADATSQVLDTAQALSEEERTRACSPSHGSVHALLVHMLYCEESFLARCQGGPLTTEEEDVATLAGIRQEWQRVQQEQQAYLQGIAAAELAREVQMTIRGQALALPVWQLMLQAVVHSVHHRGELSIVLTGLGHPLPTSDIILWFVRESGQSWPFAE